MPTTPQALAQIAAGRRSDPLAPVTVVVPSHVAALQLRRRLAHEGAYAAVRFETLPRLAEIIAAGELATSGRQPLARPIGDYVCERVAGESAGALAQLRDLAGYPRVLRQLFRRLRRGGVRSPDELAPLVPRRRLGQIVELYGRFRELTAGFYDEEDLLEAAAAVLVAGRAGFASEIGAVYVVPPPAGSAGADSFLAALRATATDCIDLDDETRIPEQRFALAPDPASEAREAVREVVAALEAGTPLNEVAVYHSAVPAYARLLRETLAAAAIPASPMPGLPLADTPAGRAVRSLVSLPELAYARTAVLDFLSLAPLRSTVPGRDGRVYARTSEWDRLSRVAGVTRSAGRWQEGLQALRAAQLAALENPVEPPSEGRARRLRFEIDETANLDSVVQGLVARLEPLRSRRSAQAFIDAFKAVVDDYLDRDAHGYAEVVAEIDQLGTVAALGGELDLLGFGRSLAANLEVASLRERGLGDGVLVADYRLAAGLSFQRAILCGAFEGALPGESGGEPLLDDRAWSGLRATLPFIEDRALRLERGREAVGRAVTSGSESFVWSCPLYEPGGSREYYPAPAMVAAAGRIEPAIVSASDLRRAPGSAWLRRTASPMASMLRGSPVDPAEAALRRAVSDRQRNALPDEASPLAAPVAMVRARRYAGFGEWDGLVGAAAADPRLALDRPVSPTALEHYATCGFRYFCRSVLRLDAVEEPEEREVMDPLARGSLVHRVLERFFRGASAVGRPRPGEPWGEADRETLRSLVAQEFELARQRGLTGRDLYARHDMANVLADLTAFLAEDSEFRLETGAVPAEFEVRVPESQVAGLRLTGFADRIDRTPDGARAWVIDYKTGRRDDAVAKPADPLVGGTKLQLPTYLGGAGAAEAVALYWFVSRKGEFAQRQYEATPANAARFEAALAAIADGIRAGVFPAVPGDDNDFLGFTNCAYCAFDRICSRRRDLEYEAKSADAAVQPWRRVAAAARGEPAP